MAVLYQNDAFGEDLLNGFKDAIKGTDIEIVAEESYEVTDPTVSLADVEARELRRRHVPQHHDAEVRRPRRSRRTPSSGWKVLHIINNVGASKQLVLEPAGLENVPGHWSRRPTSRTRRARSGTTTRR